MNEMIIRNVDFEITHLKHTNKLNAPINHDVAIYQTFDDSFFHACVPTQPTSTTLFFIFIHKFADRSHTNILHINQLQYLTSSVQLSPTFSFKENKVLKV